MMKSIFKLLGLTLFTSNFSIYSSMATSTNEIPNRYQTLEGEYITIDDSMDGNLEEIEIFGNTVQDKNNLKDIQSVGDLYVDEDGNPILDKQGNKQYKIDIITQEDSNGMRNIGGIGTGVYMGTNNRLNYNTFTISNTNSQGNTFSGYTGINFNVDKLDESLIGKQVEIKFKLLEFSGDTSLAHATVPPHKWNTSGNENFSLNTYEQQARIMNISKITEGTTNLLTFEVKPTSESIYAKAEIEVNVIDGNTYGKNTTSILLPYQLMKVKDVADRLYWDNEKGRYVVEKNIGALNLSNPDYDYNIIVLRGEEFARIEFVNCEQILVNEECMLTYDLAFTWDSLGAYENYSLRYDTPSVVLSLNRLGGFEKDVIKNYLVNNPLIIYNRLKTPIYLETNITSKLKIPTYEDKTHIYIETENGINPTLKVKVDRLPQIANNSKEEAKVNPTSTNISLARMYINMLPESIYKDQLQEQLSQIFSSDIVLDRKSSSANVDIYIIPKNNLTMTLNTNSITFDEFDSTNDLEILNAVEITVNSSLPYELNASLPTGISNSDKDTSLPVNILNIKESNDLTYKTFSNINEKLIIKDESLAGINIHKIDLKLSGGLTNKADVYKTTLKFEAKQK